MCNVCAMYVHVQVFIHSIIVIDFILSLIGKLILLISAMMAFSPSP